MNRLQISKLGRAKFILKEGGSMGDLYSTTDLRRDDKGNIEIDEGGNVVVEGQPARHETRFRIPGL